LPPRLPVLPLLALAWRANSAIIRPNPFSVGAEGLEEGTARCFGRAGIPCFAGFAVCARFIARLSHAIVGAEALMQWSSLLPSLDQTKGRFRPLTILCYRAFPCAAQFRRG
jgi:hypothetical protein